MASESEAGAVLDANDRFYRAFESLDMDRMAAVWQQDASARCVHPGWPMLAGWEQIGASWERIFDNAAMMQFSITDAEVSIEGAFAWVTCTENLTTVVDARVNEARVQTTNLFHKIDGLWLLVHHHGSPVM